MPLPYQQHADLSRTTILGFADGGSDLATNFQTNQPFKRDMRAPSERSRLLVGTTMTDHGIACSRASAKSKAQRCVC